MKILHLQILDIQGFYHTCLIPRLGGRLNLAWAVWAVKLICELLVEKSCLAFFKICLKIHFYTSNLQISFTAQTAQPKFSLPPRRGLKLVCSYYFMFMNIILVLYTTQFCLELYTYEFIGLCLIPANDSN